MSYFNFKLFNKPVKNVNTDLAFKKGNWAPGNPVKGGRAPILGYRKNLDCNCDIHLKTLWPTSFEFIDSTGITPAQYLGVYEADWDNWIRTNPSNRPYIPIYKNVNGKYITPNSRMVGETGVGASCESTATNTCDEYGNELNIFDQLNGGVGTSNVTGYDVYGYYTPLNNSSRQAIIRIQLNGSLYPSWNDIVYNQENITKQLSPFPQTVIGQPWVNSNPQFINFKYELNKQPTGNLFNILPKKETLDSNEKIYKDNWAKSCATNPEVCYNPVIKRIQNKNGKVDTNYNYNTRNLLRSRFLTYEQNAYNFDLTNYITLWPTSFEFIDSTGITNPDYLGVYEADWDNWIRTNKSNRPYIPLYKNSNGKYLSPNSHVPPISLSDPAYGNELNIFDSFNSIGFSNVRGYDIEGYNNTGAGHYRTAVVRVELNASLFADWSFVPYSGDNIFKQLSPQEQTAPDSGVLGVLWNGSLPEFINFSYDLKKQPAISSEIWKILPKTLTTEYASDKKNHSYTIHNCTCEEPLTASNPCKATYKPLNPQFAVNTAVTGRSRIARLKYNTKKRVAITKTVPFGLLGYPKNSCEFCKRDFKALKGRKGGDDKRRINSRLGPRYKTKTCCNIWKSTTILKLCTEAIPDCTSVCPFDYSSIGALRNPLKAWTGSSGCDPDCGRLGIFPYPEALGEICPQNITYRGFEIGGFAWNPQDKHLWFFLKEKDKFNGGAVPSGYQFGTIEFSSSPNFESQFTVKLFGIQDGVDYNTNTGYEIHWSGENIITNFTTANIAKINTIFGTLQKPGTVYIKFEPDIALELALGGMKALPGQSPSYVLITYNQQLNTSPLPSIGNFTIINKTKNNQVLTITGIDIITEIRTNDTVRLEMPNTAIDADDEIICSYNAGGPVLITSLNGNKSATAFTGIEIIGSKTVPDKPLNLQGNYTNNNLILSWDAPDEDGGSPITNYKVQQLNELTNEETEYITNSTSTTYTISSGLTTGIEYIFTVRAVNDIGDGAISGDIEITPSTVPTVPINVTGVGGDHQVVLSWNAPQDNGGSEIIRYEYNVYQGAFVDVGLVTTYTVTGLTNGAQYSFNIRAVNINGPSPSGSPFPDPITGAAPTPPTNLQAQIGDEQVTLTWGPPLDNGGGASTSYEYSTDNINYTQTGQNTTVNITGLTNGQTYTFYVRAFTNLSTTFGKSNPTSVSATPGTLPGPPTNLSAISGNTTLALEWDPPTDNGGYTITGYEYRETSPSSGSLIFLVGEAIFLTGLTNGTEYTYEVYSKTSLGSSSTPASVSGTPATLPDPPTNFSGTNGTHNTVDLSWTAPVDDGGSPVTNYVLLNESTVPPSSVNESGTSYTWSSLDDGLSYNFSIMAQNAVGNSTKITGSSIAVGTVPGVPTSFTATPGGTGEILLSWTAPTDTGSNNPSAPWSLTYMYNIDGGTYISNGTNTSVTVSGLNNGQSYAFRVYAENAIGDSNIVGPVSGTPQIILPGPGSVIANMPANRGQSPAVAGYNNKLYVFGGKYSPPAYTSYKSFVVYDTTTNSWSSQSKKMSVARAWVDGAIWQDKVYIYSGTSDQSAQSHQTMEIYDITNDSFTSVATPDKRINYAAGAINGKIYICGGYSVSIPAGVRDTIISYDTSTGNFETALTSMPTSLQQHAAAVYNNKLYVMGGNNAGGTTQDSLYEYDPAGSPGGTWTTLATMPAGRYSLKAATLGSYIYAVGGSVGSLVDTVYRYDPANNDWKTVIPMGTSRASFGLGVANNAMFAVGDTLGSSSGGERINDFPSEYTVGGEFIFTQGNGWGSNGMVIFVDQSYLLKNVDPNGGSDKYVGFSASSGVAGSFIEYCFPEGPPTYIPNQSGGLRLPLSNANYPGGALYPMKFKVEIDLPTNGWTDMGECDIWMASSFDAGGTCSLLVAYFDLDNNGAGELNAKDKNNWTTALGGSGDYIGQTIRITYVSGGIS